MILIMVINIIIIVIMAEILLLSMNTELNPEPDLNPALSIDQGQKSKQLQKLLKEELWPATMRPRVRCAKSLRDFAGK